MMQMTEYEITVLLVFLSLFAGGFIDRHKKENHADFGQRCGGRFVCNIGVIACGMFGGLEYLCHQCSYRHNERFPAACVRSSPGKACAKGEGFKRRRHYGGAACFLHAKTHKISQKHGLRIRYNDDLKVCKLCFKKRNVTA